MSISPPRIVIAGTHSGVGKTSVALAIISALRKRGLRVQAFKVGPDYLDPTYLSAASGNTCYNLDGWMTGRDYVCSLFMEKASRADVAVIEGVMGLFDGRDPVDQQGSTAEIAAWLRAPVLLVVDVQGLSRSVAALVKGYTEFQPEIMISGVIANRCGSERHGAWLSESLRSFAMPSLVASLPLGSIPVLPSRHLGLVTADPRSFNPEILSQLGQAMERYGSMEDVLNIARSAPPLPRVDAPSQRSTKAKKVSLGVARDAAFHFYYPDNLEALQARGCEIGYFSPLADASIPEGLDGLYLGGGYPEQYARELSQNTTMLDSIRSFSLSGKPVYAECGGLMYLSRGIQQSDGRRFQLVGLLPCWARMLDRLKFLGYVEVTLCSDSLLGKRGQKLRGHVFHYSELVGDPVGREGWRSVYCLRYALGSQKSREGFQRDLTLASYVHLHFASRPKAVERFLSLCNRRP